MYAYIKGTLIASKPDQTIVDVAGIGYLIYTPLTFYTRNKTLGSTILLYTSFITREDSMRLFGFETEEDKSLFEKLISISGLGPKTALSIIGQSDSINLSKAISEKNSTSLTSIPGIGKKTAERIIIELSDKIKTIPNTGFSSSIAADAISALITLGYKEKEAAKNVNIAMKSISATTTLSELISLSLSNKSLSRN